MASTNSSRCVNLVKTLSRLKLSANASCDYSTTQRSYFTTVKPLLQNLGGSSLNSLPGNRLLPSSWSQLQSSCRMKSVNIADEKVSMNLGVPGIQELEDFTPLNNAELQQAVSQNINQSLEQGNIGRLFAVVYIRGMQYKVTPEDIIRVKFDFPPNVGDRIRLEKVLAVGGKDFSLIGQPLLSRDIVRVDATVVEKTLSHNRVWLVYRKRKSFQTFHLYREKFTMLVINSIQVAKYQ